MVISRKIKIIALITFVIFIAFAYFIFTTLKTTQVVQRPLPVPSIPNLVPVNFPITLNVNEQGLKLPTLMPVLEVSNTLPMTQGETTKIANILGFTENPIISNDISEGTTYLWNGSNSNLTIYSESRRIDYVSTNPVLSSLRLDQQGIISTAKKFLIDSKLFSDNEISFSFLTYMHLTPGQREDYEITTDPSKASLYQVNFNPVVAKAKIFTLKPEDSPIYVWITPDGSIKKVTVIKADIKEGAIYPLKSFTDISKGINEAKIVSLGNGNITLTDVDPQTIQDITINKIETGYVSDTFTTKTYQPIFLLKGQANIKGSSSKENVVLYLPAVKSGSNLGL